MATDITLLFIGTAYAGKTSTCVSILNSLGINNRFGAVVGNHYYPPTINMESHTVVLDECPIKLTLIELPIPRDSKMLQSIDDILQKGINAVVFVDNIISINASPNHMPYSSAHILTKFIKLYPHLINRMVVITTYSNSIPNDSNLENQMFENYFESMHKEIHTVHPDATVCPIPLVTFENTRAPEDTLVDTQKLLREIKSKWPEPVFIDKKPYQQKPGILDHVGAICNNIINKLG